MGTPSFHSQTSKMIYWSDLIPGVTFDSAEEMLAAEKAVKSDKSRLAGLAALNKFQAVKTQVESPENQSAVEYAGQFDEGQEGARDWLTDKTVDINKLASGQELRKNYSSPIDIARREGLPQHEATTPEVKTTMDDLREQELLDVRRQTGGGRTGTGTAQAQAVRKAEWERISAMPEGPEKEKAKDDFLMWTAPSVGYNASPAAIVQAGKRSGVQAAAATAARIGTESRMADVAAKTAGTIAEERTAGAIRGEMGQEYADMPEGVRPTKKVTPEAADKIALKAQGIAGAARFKKILEAGEVNAWDITWAGDFTNPEANQAYQDMIEALARMNTGAAFTTSEDERFARELGNWKMLTTEAGRKTIAGAVQRFIDRQEGSAATMWGNDGWKSRYGLAETPAEAPAPAKRRPPPATRDNAPAGTKRDYGKEYGF